MLKTFSATKNFKYCAILSVLLVAAGLVALLAAPFGVNLFNLDIDFAGGTSFTYQLGEEVTPDVIDKVEDAVAEKLLEGTLKEGDTAKLTVEDDKLVVTK